MEQQKGVRMDRNDGFKKMDVVREDSKVISIGNGTKRTVNPKDVMEKGASELQVFCLKCPRFRFLFEADSSVAMLAMGERMEGRLSGVCFAVDQKREHDFGETKGDSVSAVLQWIDCKKIDSHGNCYFRPDSIPITIKTQVDAFVKKAKCPADNNENCDFYMERTLKEWNTKK